MAEDRTLFARYLRYRTCTARHLPASARYFWTARKEQRLIRLDVGKLAEEIHLLRQQIGRLVVYSNGKDERKEK
jgi:hypothetical protein